MITTPSPPLSKKRTIKWCVPEVTTGSAFTTQGDLERRSVETATQPRPLLFIPVRHTIKPWRLSYVSIFTRKPLKVNQVKEHDGNRSKYNEYKQQQRPFWNLTVYRSKSQCNENSKGCHIPETLQLPFSLEADHSSCRIKLGMTYW